MADYKIKYTDLDIPAIPVVETEVNDTALDVTLFGRINPEYGQVLNEDLLNILENFACPETPFIPPFTTLDYQNATPLLARTSKEQLHRPTEGQFWYNTTRDMMYVWNSQKWTAMPMRENYAANWGTMVHGQLLPRPVSPLTGHTFEYQDCIWSVAPAAFVGKFSQMDCSTDTTSRVTMQYRLYGNSAVQDGLVNYLIIGIRGNYNNGAQIQPTPTPSVTATIGASPTPQPTATPTPSITRTPNATSTRTPTQGVSATPQATLTSTPTITPTVTITSTLTPTPLPPSATPTPTAFSAHITSGYFEGVSSAVSFIRYILNADGINYIATTDFGTNPNETWRYSGSSSDYEVRATVVTGGVNTGSSATGSWLNLGTTQDWRVSTGGISDYVELTIEIRKVVGSIVVTTANIILQATNES